MAETKTGKPKGTRKPKPTPSGQGSMDFNGKPPLSGEGNSLRRTPLNPNRSVQMGGPFSSGGRYGSSGPTDARFNAVGPNNPKTRAGMGGRPMVSSPVTQPGAALAVRQQSGVPALPERRIPGGRFDMPGLGPVRPSPTPSSSTRYSGPNVGDSTGRGNMGVGPNNPNVRDYFGKGGSASSKNNPITNPGAALQRVKPGGALTVVDKADDAVRAGVKVAGKGKGNWKARLGLGALALGTAGATYLLTRGRNDNEAVAKPAKASPEVMTPGRNAPPSSGNESDRILYPQIGGGETTRSGSGSQSASGGGPSASQPSLTDRVRNNNKANRNPDDYLGEAFDATVRRGREVGRKHLQGMIARDSVDETTARNLMSRYDKEINSQSTLKDYKSKGVTQQFDRENPMKSGRLLDEYRAMGRSGDSAPKGATLADLKARALR